MDEVAFVFMLFYTLLFLFFMGVALTE